MDLHTEMTKFGSFPKGERDQPYQEYYVNNKWIPAEREIVNRASLSTFDPQPYERIVELGCQTGGFMQYAWLKGARDVTGVDYDEDYIRLACKLNTINGFDIKYFVGDANDKKLLNQLITGDRIDHLLLMSMGKHIGAKQLFYIIDFLNPRKTYLETNAIGKDPFPYIEDVKRRNGKIVCETHDRNTRIIYIIPGK